MSNINFKKEKHPVIGCRTYKSNINKFRFSLFMKNDGELNLQNQVWDNKQLSIIWHLYLTIDKPFIKSSVKYKHQEITSTF